MKKYIIFLFLSLNVFASAIHHKIPMLDEFKELKELQLKHQKVLNDATLYSATLYGKKLKLIVPKNQSTKVLYLYFDNINAASFIPVDKKSYLNELFLHKVVFILSKQKGEMPVTNLPEILYKGAQYKLENDTIKYIQGLSVIANLNIKETDILKETFSFIGIEKPYLTLQGSLPLKSFNLLSKKNIISQNEKENIKKNTSLHVILPKPKLPHFSSFLQISGLGVLNITSKKNKQNTTQKGSTNKKQSLSSTISFPVKINLPGLNLSSVANINLEAIKSGDFTLNIPLNRDFNEPFGIKSLKIHSGDFTLDLKKNKNKNSNKERSQLFFSGISSFGNKQKIPITAQFKKTNNKYALNYLAIPNKFSLADIPGASKIPYANEFSLQNIRISQNGIAGESIFNKLKVNAYLFKTKEDDSYNLAIEQNNFKFTEILKELKKIKPLKNITIPKAALVFSEKGFSAKKEDFSDPSSNLFGQIFQTSNVNIFIKPGVNFLSSFNKKDFGTIGKGLSKIGVSNSSVIAGSINGIFGGIPGFSLQIFSNKTTEGNGIPTKVFSFSKLKIPNFYINVQENELDAGATIDTNVKVGKKILSFDTKIGFDFNQKGVGVLMSGKLNGDWKAPFGIKPLSLSNVTMQTGINDAGEVNIGFFGESKLGNTALSLATNMNILLEDALPDSVAFSTSINKLSAQDLLNITEALMGLKGKLDLNSIPFFEIHEAKLAFATPGATDPQFGLVSDGFAMSGKFFFANKELGNIKGSGSSKGLDISGKLEDFNIDILNFTNNSLSLNLNATPNTKINSTISIFDIKQNVVLNLNPPKFAFQAKSSFGSFGNGTIDVYVDGYDLTNGQFNKKSNIRLLGEFTSNLSPWLNKEIQKGLQDLKDSANAKLESSLKDLDNAQKKVNEINAKISKIKSQDNRAKNRAEDKLRNAKHRVDHLKGKYHHAKHEERHCGNKWTHWACKGYWRGVKNVDYALYKAAEGVLKAAEKTVAAAFDVDPRLAELLAEKDIATEALSLAKAVVKTDKDATDFVTNKLEVIVKDTIKKPPFQISQAFIFGDLRGVVKNDDPLLLDMKFLINGKKYHENFAIKLKDLQFDAASFALLPAMILDEMTTNVLKKADPKIAQWMKAHIATQLALAEKRVRDEVASLDSKYKKALDTYTNNSKAFKAAYESLDMNKSNIISKFQISDLMPDSLVFNEKYLAVGHSDLCLGVASNSYNVIQKNCKDIQTEQWSTRRMKDGYVQLITKGLCLKAKKSNPSRESGEFLSLSQCNDDEHELWKVENYDNFYTSIVNKYSQKCLHFNLENANPKSSYAIWSSCMGADSQTFRIINDAQKPTHFNIKTKIQAQNGQCVGVKKDFNSKYKQIVKNTKGYSNNYKLFREMTTSSYENELVSVQCDSKEAEKFNYTQRVDGDIKLVSATNGWCIVRSSLYRDNLALMPCDRGIDMLWRNNAEGTKSFQMYNTKSNLCLNIPNKIGENITLKNCQKTNQQSIEFIKR